MTVLHIATATSDRTGPVEVETECVSCQSRAVVFPGRHLVEQIVGGVPVYEATIGHYDGLVQMWDCLVCAFQNEVY